jgi:hypothetical protein
MSSTCPAHEGWQMKRPEDDQPEDPSPADPAPEEDEEEDS